VRVIREGDQGPEVTDLQQRLAALGFAVDPGEIGRFGHSTLEAVRSFQNRRRLRTDGLVGPDTWGQLVESGFLLGDRTLYLRAPPYRGDDVRALQRKLNALGFDAGREDGVLGVATDRAVREFQRNVGDQADGVVGLHTIETLDRMRPFEDAQSRAVVREAEELRGDRGGIDGRLIAIVPEPGAGAGDGPSLTFASALVEALATLGAKPLLLQDAGDAPATAANDIEAELCLSLHMGEPLAGPTCAYFGNERTHSPAGKHLAELILAEFDARIGGPGRLEPLTATILRETRMPAVQIELPAGAPLPLRSLADGVANGVRRFFEGDYASA